MFIPYERKASATKSLDIPPPKLLSPSWRFLIA